MRLIAVVSVVCLVAVAAGAQVVPVAPVFYGFRNSVIDHNGRVVVFDVSYLYPPVLAVDAIPVRFPPTLTTRVTVIESSAAARKQDAQYEGTFQVVGVGRYAVYAIITNYPISTLLPQAAPSITRQLVAIGPSFPTLPSVDIPLQSDVKVSPVGDDGVLDTIAFVDNTITPLLGVATGSVEPLPPTPVQRRTVQMYQSDGKSFNALPVVTLP